MLGSILVLMGVRIVMMWGDEVIEGGTVLIECNWIVVVGSGILVLVGVIRVDLIGKIIIFGLVDVYVYGVQVTGGLML